MPVYWFFVCVCVFVCMYVCMYVHIHACMYVCVYVCIYIYIYKFILHAPLQECNTTYNSVFLNNRQYIH